MDSTEQAGAATVDTSKDVSSQTPTQQPGNNNPIAGAKEFAKQILSGWSTTLAGAVIDLLQMLLGPIVFMFMMIHHLILLVLWVLGPLTVGLMMYDTRYFKSWIEQYVQVSLWPLITELMIGMVAFMREGINIDSANPAGPGSRWPSPSPS